MPLVIGWLEMLVILRVADVSTKQEIFDWIHASSVGVYYNPMLGI